MSHRQILIRQCLLTGRMSPRQYWTPASSLCVTNAPSVNNQTRAYSSPARRPGLWGQFMENMKQEFAKNKEMKENLKKFREEREKLEQSEALKKARTKFQSVESEASKSSELLKEKLGIFKEKVQEAMGEVGKSDIAKKAGQFTEGIGKSAKEAAEKVSEQSQQIGSSGAFKTVSDAAKFVQKEMDVDYEMYKPPIKLRKRRETVDGTDDVKPIEPNQDATGIELHKDSKFYQSWQNFRDNNQYINKIMDLKMKYDESDNPLIRASRAVTDNVVDIVKGVFSSGNSTSQALTEITKQDPNFEPMKFLRDCEKDIIPNVLEAMVRGDLEILQDWCHHRPFSVLSMPIKEAQKIGAHFDSKVLDISGVDLHTVTIMEEGPVITISFSAQQIMCLRDSKGKVIEGDPNKVIRVQYVWALCRDMTELDPRAAWKLLDLAASSTNQLI